MERKLLCLNCKTKIVKEDYRLEDIVLEELGAILSCDHSSDATFNAMPQYNNGVTGFYNISASMTP